MKRIAIFLDGTWNTTDNNTNVWRLRSLCDPGASSQVVYYRKGVGTSFGEKVRGGVLGYGIDNEIIDAYTWLAQCFESGDELFIFGFSRGAYTARSLSGLIAKCGIIQPGAPLSIAQLYARYRRRVDRTIDELLHGDPADLEERWIIKYCDPAKIKMVGVWDTVGSLGSPIGSMKRKVGKYVFLDTHLRLKNQFAFQALAIDEHRKSFQPTLWTRTIDNVPAADTPPARPLSHIEQRWFVGAHANVGGGYPSDILAQPPLEWLMTKASALGLQFRSTFVADRLSPSAPIADSFADFGWGMARFLSARFYRPIGIDSVKGTIRTTERINETLDGSVFDRWRGNPDYRPPNLKDWALRRNVDPSSLTGARLASDPAVAAA
ncbi:MAG: hypothetical protein NVS3B5_07380 [Sphingomicrobium sp.]